MRKTYRIFTFSIFLAAVLLMAACGLKTPPVVPITVDNFTQLEPAVEGNVNQTGNLAWTPDSQSLTIESENGVTRFNASTLEKETASLFGGYVTTWDVSSDGNTLIVSNDNQSIQLVDAVKSTEILSISPGYILNNASFSADGKKLLTSSNDAFQVDIWDAQSGENLKTLTGFETAAPVYSAAFAENNRHIIWKSRGRVQVSDSETGFISAPFDHEDWVTSWVLSEDGEKLATLSSSTLQGRFVPTVLVWDTASGEPRMLMNDDDPYDALAFCPGTHLIAVAEQGRVSIIDLDVFSELSELLLPGGSITDMAFSPDASALAAVNIQGNIAVWKISEE